MNVGETISVISTLLNNDSGTEEKENVIRKRMRTPFKTCNQILLVKSQTKLIPIGFLGNELLFVARIERIPDFFSLKNRTSCSTLVSCFLFKIIETNRLKPEFTFIFQEYASALAGLVEI